jgi:hypothetical protein
VDSKLKLRSLPLVPRLSVERHSVSLLPLGNYTAANFSLSSGSTGTVVSDPPTGVATDLYSIPLVVAHNT